MFSGLYAFFDGVHMTISISGISRAETIHDYYIISKLLEHCETEIQTLYRKKL